MGTDFDNLFEDVEGDPLWQVAGLLANAPLPQRYYVSLAWLAVPWSAQPPTSSWPC